MKLLNFKGKKGITLIALVITIIVLLILAGVTIAMVVGDNGILSRSNEAKETTNIAKIQEEIDLKVADWVIEYQTINFRTSDSSSNGEIKAMKENGVAQVADNTVVATTYNNAAEYVCVQINAGRANKAGEYTVTADTKTVESETVYEVSVKDTSNKELTSAVIGTSGKLDWSVAGSSGESSSSAMIEEQYGGLVTEEEVEACEGLFTYTFDDTNKTATATGLNFANIVPTYAEHGTDIQSAEDAAQIAETLRTLVVPYEVEHNGEMYSVTGLKYPNAPTTSTDYADGASGWAPWSSGGSCDFSSGCVPNLSAGSYYTSENGATTSDESSLIIPASVTTLIPSDDSNELGYSLPRTNVIFSSGSSITNLNRFLNNVYRVENVVLPDSILDVDVSSCIDLLSINIPSGATSIENGAFCWCKSITSVNIPSTVTSIGNGAFYECLSLTSINIPSGVTSIGDSTFLGCYSLTSINIPSSVTSIGEYAFDYCNGLTSINIPSSVTTIGKSAFENCSNLTSVNIPSSVISIGEKAFDCVYATIYVETEAVKTLVENSGYNGTIVVDASRF